MRARRQQTGDPTTESPATCEHDFDRGGRHLSREHDPRHDDHDAIVGWTACPCCGELLSCATEPAAALAQPGRRDEQPAPGRTAGPPPRCEFEGFGSCRISLDVMHPEHSWSSCPACHAQLHRSAAPVSEVIELDETDLLDLDESL